MLRINKLVIDSTATVSDLCELATEFPTDKSPYHFSPVNNHRHAYTAVYDFLFAQRRFENLVIGELGVLDNNSMNAWRSYFPNATLYGFDFDLERLEKARAQTLPRTHYALIDVDDRNSIFGALNSASVTFDILIDDSTHLFDHQINAIDVGLNFIRTGGVLIIEDVFRNWDEARYQQALKAYYPYFSSAYFVETNHECASSEGHIEPYYNNDKLLVLFRNALPVIRRHPTRELNRTLLNRTLKNGKVEIAELAAPRSVSSPTRYDQMIPGPCSYVVTHLNRELVHRPEFTTIHCGRTAAGRPPGSFSDILKDGSCLVNRRWSELSAMYRVWQDGPRSEIVGFSHYRRYLSFDLHHHDPVIVVSDSDLQSVHDCCYNRKEIEKVCPSRCIVSKPQAFEYSVYEAYRTWHNISHYEVARRIAVERYPHLVPEFERHLKGRDMYTCNLFYLCWEDFDELCRFWFSVLGDFCSEISWPSGHPYQDRDVAFLAERLFDVWIRTKQAAGLELDERTMLLVK